MHCVYNSDNLNAWPRRRARLLFTVSDSVALAIVITNVCTPFTAKNYNGSCFKLIINFKRRKLSKLSIVELTIGDSYWIETFTIDPYYRDTRYRNASIVRCIGPPLTISVVFFLNDVNLQKNVYLGKICMNITKKKTLLDKIWTSECTRGHNFSGIF